MNRNARSSFVVDLIGRARSRGAQEYVNAQDIRRSGFVPLQILIELEEAGASSMVSTESASRLIFARPEDRWCICVDGLAAPEMLAFENRPAREEPLDSAVGRAVLATELRETKEASANVRRAGRRIGIAETLRRYGLHATLDHVGLNGGSFRAAPYDVLNPRFGFQATIELPSDDDPKGFVELKGEGSAPSEALLDALKKALAEHERPTP